MALESTNRHSAPPPSDIHKYLVDPDDTGFYDRSARPYEIESGLYEVPLAYYLAGHVNDGDLLVDAGCGEHPVSVEMLMQNADRCRNVRVVALDGMNVDDIKQNIQTTLEDTRQCLVVACDLNRLNSKTLLQNDRRTPKCASRLLDLQEFLAEKGGLGKARADVLFLGNVLPSIDLGEPLDFLLSKVKPGGKIVIAGTPDIRWSENQRPPKGRLMSDFHEYLDLEGHRVLSREYCGYVLKLDDLKRIGKDVIRPVCIATKFGKDGTINDNELIATITAHIVDASADHSGTAELGSFEMGGHFRSQTVGYVRGLRVIDQDLDDFHYVSIPVIFSRDGLRVMFAAQEVIVAEKSVEPAKKRPASTGRFPDFREMFARVLFRLSGGRF